MVTERGLLSMLEIQWGTCLAKYLGKYLNENRIVKNEVRVNTN